MGKRPLSVSPLIGERISKRLGRKRVNVFKSPYEGYLGGLFFLIGEMVKVWVRDPSFPLDKGD